MTYPTIFFNLAAGNQPASLLDTMFNIAGGMGNIPTTAVGTNAITLTPNTNYYQPAAYANYQMVTFAAVATSNGAVTAALGALAQLKVYMPTLIQAGSGDMVLGTHYTMVFCSDLDAANGGWLVLNATVTANVQPVQGGRKQFKATNNSGTPNTQVDIAADEVMLENTLGGTYKAAPIANTINLGATGANALDTGAIAASKIYYLWVIYNSAAALSATNPAGLASLSSTAPTMPAGYSYKALLGVCVTDAGSLILRFTQLDNYWSYRIVAGSSTLTYPALATGVMGTYSTTSAALTYFDIPLTNFVPPAPLVSKVYFQASTQYANATASALIVAPTADYSGPNTTHPAPLCLPATASLTQIVSFAPEATSVKGSSNAGGAAVCLVGFDLNL